MKRRLFLQQLGASGMAFGTGAAFGSSHARGAETQPLLTAVVEAGGQRLVYSERDGEDLGDFRGDGFVQRCKRVMRPDSALTVYFRPDASGSRQEVVFELGRLWGKANQDAAHFGPYKATVLQGDRVLSVNTVQKHWWMSRWRWQSARRPVAHDIDSLMSSRVLLPMSPDLVRLPQPVRFDKCVYTNPMDNAGIHFGMGDTGEREDIGPLTEWQAAYVNTRSSEALRATLAQGEGAGSMPIHYRDEKTGAPIDFFQYPDANWYYQPHGNQWIKGNNSITEDGHPSCPWRMDVSHDPAVNFLPYLLTGDPYFLEELQFQATQVLGWTAYFRSLTKLQVVNPGQTRGYAWSLRTMFHVVRATPDSVPRWLKPKSYWKHILDDNRTWFSHNYVSNPSPATAVFHAATQLASVSGWQEDFLAFVLGWGVWMGFEEWREAYLWKLQATLARTNGKSGWPRQYCSPYYYKIGQSLPDTFVIPAEAQADTWFHSWKEAWDAFVADPKRASTFVSGVPGQFTDDASYQEKGQNDYLTYTRAVLAAATELGVRDAAEPFKFVHSMTLMRHHMTNKWAYAAIQS